MYVCDEFEPATFIFALKILANTLKYSPVSVMHIYLTICKNSQ